MKINVGKPDKIARIVLGVVIIGLGVAFGSWWGVIGLVPLLTGLINFCPIYHLLGMSTCKTCHSDDNKPQ
ncbi:MAG: DUF2892 domain-containing protein [Moraxella sp.]|uniref:YgaP family membrane protein n=1 Tax=Moraxella sp. TaxID=479 RepID=UPI0026DCA323|nr:DUF2892 domain-containing protein [Moraxella sp.]MDO4450616.1 DUF2892 domain-containing protein [Moraxella sp.]